MNLNAVLKCKNSNIEGQTIYRFINYNDEVIYVGRTCDIFQRMKSHVNMGSYEDYKSICRIEYVVLDNYKDTVQAELYFISKYKPRFNKNGKSINCEYNDKFENLNWEIFRYYPEEEIEKELDLLYEEEIYIKFNMSKLWLYLNYLNVSLENWQWRRGEINKLESYFDSKIVYLMNSVHNELLMKIKYEINKKFNYLDLNEIGVRLNTMNMELFFKNKTLHFHTYIQDIYGFDLVCLQMYVNIIDCE